MKYLNNSFIHTRIFANFFHDLRKENVTWGRKVIKMSLITKNRALPLLRRKIRFSYKKKKKMMGLWYELREEMKMLL